MAVANRYPPWSIGGYEVAAAGAVRALRGNGHAVRVLTTVPDPSDRALAAEVPDVHRELRWYWRDHQFPPLGLRATMSLERSNARVLARHVTELRPDVVMWWAMGGMSLSLLEQVGRAGLPAVGAVGDDWMGYGPHVDRWTRLWRGPARLAAPIAERLTGVPTGLDLGRAARWTFNSNYTLQTARATGLELSDAVVAHPGVDTDHFRFRAPDAWGWRLLYCGRLDPRKGTSTAIEALARLPPAATLTIHGEGERRYRDELQRIATRLGVAERVRFQSGDHRDVPDVYAAADAVVFPVKWQEPWGLVPLEAMAVGRLVVASRAGGGAAEYLRHEHNCLKFPPGDASALAKGLTRVSADSELRRRLTAAGLETASQFTAQRFHAILERELLRAMDAAGGGVR